LREHDVTALEPMLGRFVQFTSERTAARRNRLVTPIEAQRRVMLTAIDQAYRRLQSAQALVGSHLASVRRVQERQGEVLARIELEDLPARIADTTTRLSKGIAGIRRRGRAVASGAQDAGARPRELEAAIDDIRVLITDGGRTDPAPQGESAP